MNAYKINGFIYVLICLCLFYSFCTSAIVFALALFGETTLGTVTSYDSQLFDQKAAPNESRRISKGYEFFANGIKYGGNVLYTSDEAWPRPKEGETRCEPIRYLRVWPRLNKPEHLVMFSEIGVAGFFRHLLSMIGSVFLFLLVDGRIVGKRRQKG
ncbi:MAG TPA: hypothetical protein GX521_01015 [Firmicutes bacterium]|nr:hypothetical protein [Bacillota bacterium]